MQVFSVPGNLRVTHLMCPSLMLPMGFWTAVLCGIMAITILIFCWQYDTMQVDSTLLWPHVSHMEASKNIYTVYLGLRINAVALHCNTQVSFTVQVCTLGYMPSKVCVGVFASFYAH